MTFGRECTLHGVFFHSHFGVCNVLFARRWSVRSKRQLHNIQAASTDLTRTPTTSTTLNNI